MVRIGGMGDAPGSKQTPARFGPYHRLASPTQTAGVAELQVRSGEIWGRTPRLGRFPQAKAYAGPLPDGSNGIEFWTEIAPDPGGRPAFPTWGGIPRDDVPVEGEFAKISCVITQVRYGPN